MPDRTQTLSVELEREQIEWILAAFDVAERLGEKIGQAPSADAEHLKAKLHAALSQPEHRDEGLAQKLRERAAEKRDLSAKCETVAAGERALGVAGGFDLAADLLAAQPPAPVLSDEERERLIELADLLDSEHPDGPLGGNDSRLSVNDGPLLRNLASREHRGEGRIAKLEALEPGWDSYGGKVPTAEALERLRGFDRALAYVPLADGGVQVEFHALGLDFEAEIDPAGQVTDYDLQPPAGEVERLRERLTSEDVRLEAARALCPDGAHWEDFRERYEADASAALGAALHAAFPPPSGSLRDQDG